MGNYDEAIELYQKTLELDQHYYPAHFCLGLVYIRQERYKEAAEKFHHAHTLAKDSYLVFAFMGYAYALAGDRDKTEKVLKQLQDRSKHMYVSPYGIAIVYTGLGKKALALHWLEKTYKERSDWLVWLNVAPEFDSLRSDRRFLELLRRIGFHPKNKVLEVD
jgi:tetratricopeptide (TPR) repeat protein